MCISIAPIFIQWLFIYMPWSLPVYIGQQTKVDVNSGSGMWVVVDDVRGYCYQSDTGGDYSSVNNIV